MSTRTPEDRKQLAAKRAKYKNDSPAPVAGLSQQSTNDDDNAGLQGLSRVLKSPEEAKLLAEREAGALRAAKHYQKR